ncbi:MAG: hypothetical protein KAS36_02720, partial [Anaerolineales bacterium]|nr:hypothetical protein [Anaerolineales bacterium]
MFAQGIITLGIVIALIYVLWKFVGEPLIVDKYCPEDELLVDAESLREKIEYLEERKQELEVLTEEVGVTAELKDLTAKIDAAQAELRKIEETRDSEPTE